MQPLIRVEKLSKRYTLGTQSMRGYRTLRESIMDAAGAPFRRLRSLAARRPATGAAVPSILWALKDVSFELERGTVLGIIGRNGAGKSTLLKVLSRIVEPTSGRAEIRGRISSLLEVGTGFHHELTGRENIFLNGAILGMSRREITAKMDQIVAFAEIDQFLDTPVKRYSSGMFVRLAFAVAAHLEPEILVVDEVLAVGDLGFQKKCLGKMSDVARQGRTVLVVSHNMSAVQHLCSRALLLNAGQIVQDGEPESVINAYNEQFSSSPRTEQDLTSHPGRAAGSVPCLQKVTMRTDRPSGKPIYMNDDVEVEFTFHLPRSVRDVVLSVIVKNQLQVPLFGFNNLFLPWKAPNELFQSGTAVCRIERIPLMPGIYSLDVYVGTFGHNLDIIADALQFEVHPADVFGTGKLPPPSSGSIFCPASWRFAPDLLAKGDGQAGGAS